MTRVDALRGLLGVVCILAPAATGRGQEAKQSVFYVSPAGNDRSSGRLAEVNADKSDGPFATLARARDVVRNIKRRNGGRLPEPVTIFLRGGTFVLTEPLVLTPEDSGTESSPVTIAAFNEEVPVLSGGRRLGPWTKGDRKGHNSRTAKLPPKVRTAIREL